MKPFKILLLGSLCTLILAKSFAAAPAAPTNLRFSDAPREGIYLGVPDPAGQVPSAIMPAIPSANEQIPAFPYDPVNMSKPEWNDGPQQYYVDSGVACDDSNNGGRGAPLAPRCTLPGIVSKTWTLSAGDQIFVVGNGATYNEGLDIRNLFMTGTAGAPIWIIGISDPSTPRWTNQPKFGFKLISAGDTSQVMHVIMDNIHFYNPNDEFIFVHRSEPGNKFEYFTFRHSTCSATEDENAEGVINDQNRSCFFFKGTETNPVRFIVLYDNDIFGMGRWKDDHDTNHDIHGLQIERSTYYFWYLANRAFHTQADGFQCSNSNQFDKNMAERPHYIYVAGNEFFENYENAFDSKGCYHVVFSENYVHDFYNAIKQANETAVIAANDAESLVGSNYEWFINNRFERVGSPFAYKGTQEDASVYLLGNFGVDILTNVLPIDSRCTKLGPDDTVTCGDGMIFAQNTFDCENQSAVVKATRNGESDVIDDAEEDQIIEFIGNAFYNCNDAQTENSPHGFKSVNSNWILTYNYNIDYRSASADVNLSRFNDTEIGNLTNVDPLFVNPDGTLNGDYSLAPGSPGRRLVVNEPAAYSLFRSLYGLDIRKDLNGKVWKSGSILTPGAFQ